MNVSRRSFLKGTTATTAVIAVPKLAESVEVGTLPERMESCDPFKDGAVYCEIDGQWEYVGDAVWWVVYVEDGYSGTMELLAAGDKFGIAYIKSITPIPFMINGKVIHAKSECSKITDDGEYCLTLNIQYFPPDLYQSLNAPYPIMLESV